MAGDILITGSGSIVFQESCFIMKGNGLELYCDGVSRWNVDKSAAEVVIENVSHLANQEGLDEQTTKLKKESHVDFEECDFFSNPSLIFIYLYNNLQKVECQSKSEQFDGKLMNKFSIRPSVDCGLQLIQLFFEGNVLKGASLIVDDGTKTDFKISKLKFHKKKPTSYFSLDETKLDSVYYITDLR